MKTKTHKCAIMGPGPPRVSLASNKNWSAWDQRMVEYQKQPVHGPSQVDLLRDETLAGPGNIRRCARSMDILCLRHLKYRRPMAMRNGARHSQMTGVSVSSLEACLWLWGIMGIYCVKKDRGKNKQVNTYVECIGNDLLFLLCRDCLLTACVG